MRAQKSLLARRVRAALTLAVLAGLSLARPALACGDGEAPIACEGSGANGLAGWMLARVTKAVVGDQDKALAAFSAGTDGFRTADTYVFCVGPDGIMSAHPDPTLRGHDVRALHDETGNFFIQTMIETAKPGQISTVRYLFPRPGSAVVEAKTTSYTKAGEQICGVGVYDADTAAPKPATPEARVASLRAKLDGEIPEAVRADWSAFLEALGQAGDARTLALARAQRDLKAVMTALSPTAQITTSAQ